MRLAAAITHAWTTPLIAWLHQPENVYRRWLGKLPMRVAWLALALAAVTPPHGTGFTICWFQNWTGLPCPGCGITRSMSCSLHGMFAESWAYHPFGLLILALFLTTAVISLLPQWRQQRIAQAMQTHAVFFNSLYLLFVATFLVFGTTRAILHLSRVFG